jgi:hypothetical protein
MFSKASELKPYGPAFSSVELKSQLDNNNYLRPLIEDAPYARSARIASRAGNRTAIAGMKTAVNSMLERADPVQVMKVLKDTVTNTR